jgi:hypothetical protein
LEPLAWAKIASTSEVNVREPGDSLFLGRHGKCLSRLTIDMKYYFCKEKNSVAVRRGVARSARGADDLRVRARRARKACSFLLPAAGALSTNVQAERAPPAPRPARSSAGSPRASVPCGVLRCVPPGAGGRGVTMPSHRRA